jgi:hypothetical protein
LNDLFDSAAVDVAVAVAVVVGIVHFFRRSFSAHFGSFLFHSDSCLEPEVHLLKKKIF